MDIMSLPVLTRSTSPKDALSKLKKSRRSLAVVVGSPAQGVVGSLALRRAKNDHQESLKDIPLENLPVIFDGEFLPHGYAKLKLPETSLTKVREHLLQTFPGMPHKQLIVHGSDYSKFQQLLPPNATRALLGYD